MASLLLCSLLIAALATNPVSSTLILEEGYTVSTLLDFNKFSSPPASGVHPYAVLPSLPSQDLVLLDSASSTFYTLSFPSSGDREAEIKHLSGNGSFGFLDGDAKVASFNKPRSFAIDEVGNVYVADRINFVIRKINRSGFTTTIAGGYSKKPGNTDGPAQNASFSNDFELVYLHQKCALVVVDRGNRLIRQINLNSKDCAHESHQSGLGAASVTVIAIASLLLGSIIGFFTRPFLNFHGLWVNCNLRTTPKQYRTNQARTTLMSFSDARNAIAKTAAFSCLVGLIKLSIFYFSVIVRRFRPRIVVASPTESGSVSLMELDVASDPTSEKNNGLKDLMCLDTGASNGFCKQGEMVGACTGRSSTGENKLDEMIQTHLSDFSRQGKQQGVLEESHLFGSRLVRRRSVVET